MRKAPFLLFFSFVMPFAFAEMPQHFTVETEKIFGTSAAQNVNMGLFGKNQPGFDLAKIIAMDSGTSENFVTLTCFQKETVKSKDFGSGSKILRTHRLTIPAKAPDRVGVTMVAELDPGDSADYRFQMTYAQRGASKSISVPLRVAKGKETGAQLETGSPRYVVGDTIRMKETSRSDWQVVALSALNSEDRKQLRQFVLMASSLFNQCADGKISKQLAQASFKVRLSNFKFNASRPAGTYVPQSLPATK